jgi:DNA replication protein DnaC
MLVFTGSPGCGKTYLCAALTEWMFKYFNTRRYHKEEKLLRTLRTGISQHGSGDYLLMLEYIMDDEVVILDDVAAGINPGKFTNRDLEFRREVFFSFLDYRYNTQRPTVITSNLNRTEFTEIYSERIASRLYSTENTIIEMFGTDLDKRSMGM